MVSRDLSLLQPAHASNPFARIENLKYDLKYFLPLGVQHQRFPIVCPTFIIIIRNFNNYKFY